MKMADNPKSKYGKKEKWRHKNCGAPLPFFPEVMAIPSHMKPWKGAK